MKIKTAYIFPPIPTRQFDWCAYDDDRHPDGPIGYGETKKAAIADFVSLMEDIIEQEEAEEEAAANGQFGVGA